MSQNVWQIKETQAPLEVFVLVSDKRPRIQELPWPFQVDLCTLPIDRQTASTDAKGLPLELDPFEIKSAQV